MERATLSSKFKKAIAALVIILIVVAGTFWLNRSNSASSSQSNSATTPATVTTQKQKVEIAKDKITYPGESGKSALELLKANTKTVTKSSSLGEYVVSINGEDGAGKKYWLFYVNGKESNVGADAYKTKNSDIITWKLQ